MVSPRRALAAAALALALAYLPRLGDARGASHPDESYYMAISAELHRAGAWATPTLDGAPLFYKPPLLYWLERASYSAVGLTVLGARLPAALAALGLAVATGALAASMAAGGAGGGSGALAALLCGGSLGFFLYGRLAMTDAPLALCLVGAFACVWRANRGDPRWLWLSGAMAGLAMLLKGPVAGLVFLVGASSFALLRARRRPDPLLAPAHLALASLAALLVAAPWYVLMLARHGRAFWHFFFVEMNVDRFRSPWTLAGLARLYGGTLVALLPWTPLALEAIVDSLRAGRWRDERRLLLLCWAFADLAVFTLPAQKWPHYGLPAIPALAILTALHVAESRATRWGAGASASVAAAAALACGVSARIVGPLALLPAALLAFTALAFALRRIDAAALAGVAALAAALGWLVPHVGQSPWPEGAALERPLNVYGQPQGLVELSSGRVARRLWSRADVDAALARGELVWAAEHDLAPPPEWVRASAPRFRPGATAADLARALREGSTAPLLERVNVLGTP